MRKEILIIGICLLILLTIVFVVDNHKLRESNRELVHDNRELSISNSARLTQINTLRGLVADRDTEIQELKNQINELKSAKKETNTRTFRVTAYCPCATCNGKWVGSKTASGTIPTAGRTIAVDPTIIPYGTEVVINGHTYIAEDSGSAIKGNRIDIFFNSHAEAMNFGVKHLEGEIKL